MHVSASSIKEYLLCQRKWAWRKIGGIEVAPHPSAALGTEGHRMLEAYFKQGTPIDGTTTIGQACLHSLPYLPTPGVAVPEEEFSFSYEGIAWNGYIDLQLRGMVIDHKFTGDFKWALTEATLPKDIAATLYATWQFLKYDHLDEVTLYWVYNHTKRRATKPVTGKITRAQAASQLAELVPVAKEMTRHLQVAKDPLVLSPSIEACEAYGGCPHRSRCNLGQVERLGSIMSQGSAAFLAAAGVNPFAAPAPATPPASPFGPAPTAAPQPINPFAQHAPAAPAPAPAAPAPVAAPAAPVPVFQAPPAVPVAAPVFQAPPAVPVPVFQAPPAVPVPVFQAPPAVPVPVPIPVEGKRRGRPPKTAAAPVPEPAQAPDPEVILEANPRNVGQWIGIVEGLVNAARQLTDTVAELTRLVSELRSEEENQ